MPRTILLRLTVLGAVANLLAAPRASAETIPPPSRPNILLVMSDDMGFSDLGCYGGEINTPNLDALATNGLRFTQFYNTARCCPTRASLITGLYPHQAGMGHMTDSRGLLEGYAGNLNRKCLTIAEALKPAGYRTYMTGKWHVTGHAGPDGPKDTWPRQRGFDKFYGTITGAGSFFDPTTLCRDNTFITPANDPKYRPARFYYTDAISDNAVAFLREHAEDFPAEPFFLYLAYTAAHWPMHALPEDIEKYQGKYQAGYAPIRAARLAKAQNLGLISRAWDLTPQAGNWDDLPNKAWEARCMEVYAAMIDRMDQGIGRIVAELKRHKRFDNTLVFFLQDNGGCAEGLGRQSNAEALRTQTYSPLGPDDLQPHIWPPMQTRDGRPVRTGPEVMPGPEDTYVAYGRSWANVSNTPFREYKHWVHEGGISSPLIVHWPEGMDPSRRHQLESTPAHLIDIMATCLDVAGAVYPTQRNGQTLTPLEGVSLRPTFAGQALARPQPLFFEHEGNRAVRDGRWKLVAKGSTGPWELYDMETDRTEMHDLAATHPDRVQALAAQWESWARRAQVLPWPWRSNDDPAEPPKVSNKTRFELKPDDRLVGAERPNVAGRALSLSVELAAPAAEGVLVAQGGTAHGFALYFKDGTLCFSIRRQGTLETISSRHSSLGTARSLAVQLARDGTVRLSADQRQLTARKTEGTLTALPVEGLQVGRDEGNAVGEYTAPFAFRGRIQSVVLSLD